MGEFLKAKTKKFNSNTFLFIITIVLFIAMYVAGMIVFADKGFAKPQMFTNLFINNAGLIVIGCGMTIVMITGGIDISVGSVTALVCMASAYAMENKGMSPYAALAISLGIGLLFGLLQGYLVSYLEIQPFIVTLAGLFLGRGLTAMISTDMISIKNSLFQKWATYQIELPIGTYNKHGVFRPAYIYPSVVIALIVVVLIAIMLRYTKFGRKLFAIGGSQQSALMMGLNVKRTKFEAYILDGLLAGLGGFLFCLNSCAGFVEQAKGFDKDAIVLIKGTITSLITTQRTLSSWWVRIVLSALLCFFIVLQALFAKAKIKGKKVEKKDVKKPGGAPPDEMAAEP